MSPGQALERSLKWLLSQQVVCPERAEVPKVDYVMHFLGELLLDQQVFRGNSFVFLEQVVWILVILERLGFDADDVHFIVLLL